MYCCISFYFYNSQDHHSEIRSNIFEYINNNKEEFYLFFQENNENKESVDNILNSYIIEHNNDGAFSGDIEYSVIYQLYQLKIILFKKSYTGLNMYNIYSTDNYNKENF